MAELRTFATAPKAGEPAVSRPCPLCSSQAVGKRWLAQGVEFLRCASCGLWRQDPQPEPSAVAARYDHSYLAYETARHLEYRSIALKSLAEAGLEPGRRPDGGSAILEIGCATGALLSVFKDRGWACAGVELSPELASYARSTFGLDVQACRLEEARLDALSFDVVMALHLIEHVNDPRAFLAAARRAVKPGGRLYLITPNADGFQAWLKGQEWRSAIRDHLYLFSVRTLGAMLKAEGFRVESARTWGGWPAGMRPRWLKKPMDAAVKRLGLGDVMVLRARPA